LLLIGRPAVAQGEGALPAVASIQPIAMIAREIGGDRVTVDSLVPPGASPHTFDPTPGDVARLARARAFVRVGRGLDDWAARLLAAGPRSIEVLTLLDLPGIAPLPSVEEHHHGAHAEAEHEDDSPAVDPHVWLDPLRVRDAMAPAIAALFARLDPEGAGYYAARRDAFAERLTALDAEIRGMLADRGRRFVSFHRAWAYFAARYGLEEVATVEEFPGEEPTPRELVERVEAARDAGIPAIMIEPQLGGRVAGVIGAEYGASTVIVDPNGDETDPERDTYEELMRFDARGFQRALGSGTR
jgi:ABC-type Zn uptake system ZnuABC Zn-binding protein ZnuA